MLFQPLWTVKLPDFGRSAPTAMPVHNALMPMTVAQRYTSLFIVLSSGLEALPSHATAIGGLVRGVLCSCRLHAVDLWIGRFDDSARDVGGVDRPDAGACATGPDVIAHDRRGRPDRKSTRLNSSHRCISYAVFCLKKNTR